MLRFSKWKAGLTAMFCPNDDATPLPIALKESNKQQELLLQFLTNGQYGELWISSYCKTTKFG
jgi:hypothetical protein